MLFPSKNNGPLSLSMDKRICKTTHFSWNSNKGSRAVTTPSYEVWENLTKICTTTDDGNQQSPGSIIWSRKMIVANHVRVQYLSMMVQMSVSCRWKTLTQHTPPWTRALCTCAVYLPDISGWHGCVSVTC
jgi:hypothetical protein